MSETNFNKWERKVFDFIKCLSQRKESERSIFEKDGKSLTPFGEYVCSEIKNVYSALPEIHPLRDKTLFHVPLCIEYDNVSFFYSDNQSLAPRLNVSYLLGKLIYLFFRYPAYEENVLVFLNKQVMPFLYFHKAIKDFKQFCMQFRELAEHLFFSSRHQDASPFLYAYMHRCSKLHDVRLFSAVKSIALAKTLQSASLKKLFESVSNVLSINAYDNIRFDFSAFYPLFETKNQDHLKQELSLRFAQDTVCKAYQYTDNFIKVRDEFNQAFYPFELHVNQLPPANFKGKTSSLDCEQEALLQSLFDDDIWDKVSVVGDKYLHTPLRFLEGLTLSEFLDQREILKAYQNQEDLAVSFAYNPNTKYPPMPVNLYWILNDVFSQRKDGKLEIDNQNCHDFLNPTLRDFDLHTVKNYFLYSKQICENILNGIDSVDLNDLLISDNSITLNWRSHTGYKIQSFILNNRHRLKEMSFLFSIYNSGYIHSYMEANNQISDFISWETEEDPNVNPYIRHMDNIIYVFPELYNLYSIRAIGSPIPINRNELNRIIMPTVWLVMCLQKWAKQQSLLELA